MGSEAVWLVRGLWQTRFKANDEVVEAEANDDAVEEVEAEADGGEANEDGKRLTLVSGNGNKIHATANHTTRVLPCIPKTALAKPRRHFISIYMYNVKLYEH